MSERLALSEYEVHSFAPLETTKTTKYSPFGTQWAHYDIAPKEAPGIWIYYRNPVEFDAPKTPSQKWWFIAQDVDYPGEWTEERLSKVDRYICLCREHARQTLKRYPSLEGRLYTSSNGIRSQYIRQVIRDSKIKRRPHHMFYASSPDRGLLLILEQWWRIKESVPDATLNVAYGFNNMETIVKLAGGNDWRGPYQRHLEALMAQEGVSWLGRLNQDKVYKEWLKASVWPYPSDFPETSCITCMEAQALGAIPVTNKYWAVGDNVDWGFMINGIPQNNSLIRHLWINGLIKTLQDPFNYREEMSQWALDNFDWNNMVNQWKVWLEEDFQCVL
jgi:glycosyltransferase involved in cell wall biosynthesis